MNSFKEFAQCTILNKIVPIVGANHLQNIHLQKLKETKKFNQFIKKLQKSQHQIKEVQVVNLFIFSSGNIGFIDLKVIYEDEHLNRQNYIFVRGNAVAILIFVNDKLLLIQQYRVTVQQTTIEPPAGMLDESGDFVGTAAKEIEEETGIIVSQDNLQYLGNYYTSHSFSEEEMFLFCCHVKLSEQKMKEVEEKVHGKESEKEKIRVNFYEQDPNLILSTKSGPLIALSFLHKNHEHLNK